MIIDAVMAEMDEFISFEVTSLPILLYSICVNDLPSTLLLQLLKTNRGIGHLAPILCVAQGTVRTDEGHRIYRLAMYFNQDW